MTFQSLKLLSVMAAIRLDDDDTDNIEKVLSVALVEPSQSSNGTRTMTVVDPLASSSWEQVHFYLRDEVLSCVPISVDEWSDFHQIMI